MRKEAPDDADHTTKLTEARLASHLLPPLFPSRCRTDL